MKKILVLALVALSTLMITSCEKEEKQQPFSVSPTSLSFESNGGSQSVYINSSNSWSASSSATWCTLSPSSGSGSSTLLINATANTSSSARSTTVRVTSNGESQVINVTQSGTGGGGSITFSVSPTSLSFESNGGGRGVYINSSNSWSASSSATWCTLSPSSGSGSSTLHVDVTANTSSSARSTTVRVTSNGESQVINVTQSGTGGGGGGTTVPSAPTGVTAANEGPVLSPYVVVRWNEVSNATSYIIYRSGSASGTYSQVGTSTGLSFYDNGATAPGTYYYKVKAKNSAGTSGYSNYASVTIQDPSDAVSPCPVQYGNCTVSGGTMTLRWTVPTSYGCGTPTTAYLRVRNPISGTYADVQTLSGTATSASFAYGMWLDDENRVYVGIITENSAGTSGGVPKIWDETSHSWLN